ncbi:MAG: hypothetical protein MUE30_04215 [Spirosomaceae bacterium]|jgi:hypothetical protein|nr:hypothetical protein [Spirosomataceae bacterium]
MKNIFYVLTFGVMMVAASSCTEKIEPKPFTYSQLLTGTEKKTWTLSSATIVDEGDKFDIPGRELLSACQLDDQFIFYANEERKLEYSNGSTKCRTTEPDLLFTDSWELTQANATLVMAIPRIFGGFLVPFTVKTLSENTLVLEVFFDDIDASYRFTFTSSSK